MKGRPGVILGSPNSVFSERTGLVFHTCSLILENFDFFRSAATCYGTRQLGVSSLSVGALDHVVVWCFLPFAVSPGTWLGGAWFPGGPRPVFRCWLCCHDPDLAFLILHQDVSHVSLAQWASPQFENHVQIFTSHLPMMNLQDQVTLTNWPASNKKKDEAVAGKKCQKRMLEQS